MKKAGRNDPCPCGSKKKFKKCCQNKMIGKKFVATKINPVPEKTLSNFFKNTVKINKEEKNVKKIKVNKKLKDKS